MTNHEWTRMDTNTEKLLLKEEVFQVVGSAVEVINTLGHGLGVKSHHGPACWRNSELQAPEIRVGEDGFMKFVSIRVHSWLTA